MRKADLWFLVGVALILLAIPMFWGVVRAATCDRWVQNTSIVTGLGGTGAKPAPAICYNCTGNGYWELISGENNGVFYGFYWNGTQWVSDSSIVAGLGDIGLTSAPAICNNCTGNGYWELIAGDYDGDFNGFYWNGTQWVSDSAIITGLGDIGAYSHPTICYNCTGSGYWELIAGKNDGSFSGFYWNGTQWVSDSAIVAGLIDIGTFSIPATCDNCTGSGYQELIAGEDSSAFHGFKFVPTYDGVVYITQNATANSSEVGIGQDITITAKAYSGCGLQYANISIYHSETGTWSINDGTFSQASLSNFDSATASITGHPAVAYCNNTIKAKITFVDTKGATATTAETSFEYNPYIASSGNTSIIPTGIMSEVDGCNATVSALADGSTWFLARVGFKYRNATFKECPYEATNADDWKITNTSEYCLINVTTQSLSSGDTVRIQLSEAYSAYPPPNLPSAIAAAGLIIIVIYTTTTRRR